MILKVMLNKMDDGQLKVLNKIVTEKLDTVRNLAIKQGLDEYKDEYTQVCKLYQYLCGIQVMR